MKPAKTIKLEEIPSQAKHLAQALRGGEIFGLVGALGSGKTTFVKAVGRCLKIKYRITSPTFTLIHLFPARLGSKKIIVYHLDLYRTKNFKEVTALGLPEIWGQKNVVTFIEWADKIKRHLPKKTKLINFIGQ